jgi:hypothetical protein
MNQAPPQSGAIDDVFNTLFCSNKQRFVLSIAGAKAGETRQRRIAVATLREERA